MPESQRSEQAPRHPAAGPGRWAWGAGVLLATVVAALAWTWHKHAANERAAAQVVQAVQAAQQQQARERGRLLFERGDGMVARMPRHADDLPALASRCSNCHALASAPATVAASEPAPRLAPVAAPALGGTWLTEPRPRRGGPPSRFDAALLCRLLGTGRDPADVVVSVTMPRYAATPAQCQDLWVFLTAPPAMPP